MVGSGTRLGLTVYDWLIAHVILFPLHASAMLLLKNIIKMYLILILYIYETIPSRKVDIELERPRP